MGALRAKAIEIESVHENVLDGHHASDVVSADWGKGGGGYGMCVG